MNLIARWAAEKLPDIKKRRLFYLFSALALITILTAWLFSAQPPEASRAQSGWLKALILRLVGVEVPELLIRKLAHFSEYFLLGLFSGLAIRQLGWRRRRALVALALALPAAGIDEAIQVFSARGPSFIDVGIDLTGDAAGLFIAWLSSRGGQITKISCV